MKLHTIALILGASALYGCSASDNNLNELDNTSSAGESSAGESSVGNPSAGNTVNGSITISAAAQAELQALPDIQFTPSEFSEESSDATRFESTVAAITDADSMVASTGSGDDGGGTTGGSDGGGTTGGSDDSGTGTSGSPSSSGKESLSGPTDASDVATPLPTIDEGYTPPQDQFRAGTLTAADYDDQLNPHLYQSYASDYLQRVGGKLDVPYLDLSKRITLNVKDQNGNLYGGVKLQFTDNNNNNELLSLTVPASGTTQIYTDIDVLPEQFGIRATGLAGSAIDETITLSDAQASGVINITLPEEKTPVSVDQATTVLDVMFVVDTTGSMQDELDYLQTELKPVINAIPYDKSMLNIGLTFYRDEGDDYVVRSFELTNDIDTAQNNLDVEDANGGGDYPEAMDQALQQAIDKNWSENSKRILFLIADAPPHGSKMRATWNAAEQARLKNIHIVPIAASGVGEDAEYLMRSIAAFTNSRYLFLTDDSGYGNSHAEPDVDCYVVTQLDNLMIRVLNSLITGERDEPTDNDIIRRVGNYDRGVCNPDQSGQ